MTEQELLKEVCRLCDERQLIYVHYPDSKRLIGQAGFPDLVIVGRHRLIFVELKSSYGQLASEQTKWRWALLAVGQRWQLWKPSDLDSGYIARTLDEL